MKQNKPQSDSYTSKSDKDKKAKPVGKRYTNKLAKKLGKSPYATPTNKDVDKYLGNGVYDEKRKDKSDKKPSKKFAGGGGVRGGMFNVGDKVMVNDSGYIKAFEGFDLSKPATIISKKKVKTSSGIKYFYGLEFFDGKKPFNNAAENKLTLADSYANGGGVGISHYKVKDEIFISYEDAMNYCDENNLSYSEIKKTKEYANGGGLGDSFNDDTNSWYDAVADKSKELENDSRILKAIEICNKEATRDNLEKLRDIIKTIPYSIYIRKKIDNQIHKILSGKYKNEFRLNFGGKRRGGGKVSATSYFFSMFVQASTYNWEDSKYAGGGKVKQNKPQSDSYTSKSDKDKKAKPVGKRYTNKLAKKLGKSPYATPTNKDVDKYLGNGIYDEKRKDKSDKKPSKKFEHGGDTAYVEISVEEMKSLTGRDKLNYPHEFIDGVKYCKCFLRPFYYRVND